MRGSRNLTLLLAALLMRHAPRTVSVGSHNTCIHYLVEKVLDLLGEVLVLPLDGVEVLGDLLVGRLHAEVLGAEVAALGLRSLYLGAQVVALRLPLRDDLLNVVN